MNETNNRVLAFSSSRVGTGEYLQTAAPLIHQFLGEDRLRIAFIPFADVKNDYAGYTSLVTNALQHLPYTISAVMPGNAREVLAASDVIMVGGGNTFKLLHDLYALKLLDIIRDKVNAGAAYIGWSAGSNITGPTIGTTNDMPVIAPPSFNALGLLPFQINPHYTNASLPGHHGETRDQRLEEFLELNPGITIAALPEGSALQLEAGKLHLTGDIGAVLFYRDHEAPEPLRRTIMPGEDISFLL